MMVMVMMIHDEDNDDDVKEVEEDEEEDNDDDEDEDGDDYGIISQVSSRLSAGFSATFEPGKTTEMNVRIQTLTYYNT